MPWYRSTRNFPVGFIYIRACASVSLCYDGSMNFEAICDLLTLTDMSYHEIALRLGCDIDEVMDTAAEQGYGPGEDVIEDFGCGGFGHGV